MMHRTLPNHRPTLRQVGKCDGWDDDPTREEENGPSWIKAYVGGVKVRRYVIDGVLALQPGGPA